MLLSETLTHSLKTGFIDKSFQSSDRSYRPELLTNDIENGKIVLSTIIHELEKCEEFWFSVAFITTGGIATIINTLIDLEKRDTKGKILASQYLNFTQPEALKRLKQFKNIELKIAVEGSYHSKGYLFKRQDRSHHLIIGSSNLTDSALKTNREWNLKISASENSELISQVKYEFRKEFSAAIVVSDQYLIDYGHLWEAKLNFERKIAQSRQKAEHVEAKPNLMQREALESIKKMRSEGHKRALIISATGTGKTFLSAFDVQAFKPKKFLFIVHRHNIARAAMRTFQNLLGLEIKMGHYSENSIALDEDYIFSTVQTISKKEHLEKFSPEYFDYIVIDESHRAGAESYRRIMEYFRPDFLLGMTATPERTDGADIYKLFNYNIAYEIRLHRALSEGMLSPFHYYGITDLSVNGQEVNDLSDFNSLTADERINRIIEASKRYGCDDGEVRGLVFCSRNEIAKELSGEFNIQGYKTIALDGSTPENDRQRAIDLLESDNKSEKLDYIFTVDIFNEGIDIPRVNQIIMLRPTQSAIIFVQQLGRGLRKTAEKQYLTVIDFIGNYSNNYLVPIALYGDTSYNKDTLRKLMASGSSQIPGTSTVNFDQISKERIFASINQASMQTQRELVHDYTILKNKLGRIPMMMDFLNFGSRDPWLYVNKYKSYYNFVQSIENEISGSLDVNNMTLLELFGLEINNGKRVEESIILQHLILNSSYSTPQLKASIKATFQHELSENTIESCVFNLNLHFVRKNFNIVKLVQNKLVIGSDLEKLIQNPTALKFLNDNILYSIEEYKRSLQGGTYIDGLILYNKYSRKDVCRILNWPLDISSIVFGYRTSNGLTPCFVTYNKSENIGDNIMYNDHFVDQQTFAWESRSNRKVENKEIQNVINSERILLFVKKEDGEGSDFYYMGDVDIIEGSVEQSKMVNTGAQVVHFKFKLRQPVEESLFKYITN
jgi:superfamily II DNA or RNA helicase